MSDREAMELARDLVRGSIIEDAASRFISQVLKEAHDSRIKPLQDRIEKLEAENKRLNEQIEAAVKRALEGAANEAKEIADQYVGYMSRIERAIRALDPAQFIDGDKT